MLSHCLYVIIVTKLMAIDLQADLMINTPYRRQIDPFQNKVSVGAFSAAVLSDTTVHSAS